MTKSKSIAQYLGLTNQQYNTICIDRYINWVSGFVKDYETDLQQLLANSAISNYYTLHFEDLENRALKILKANDGSETLKTLRELYNAIVVDIFNHYPKPLIDAARKLTIINNLN